MRLVKGRSIQRPRSQTKNGEMEDHLDVHDRLLDFAAVPDLLEADPDPSFFVRVGAAPVLLFVVVTAPLLDKALFKDRTKTVGSES